MSDGASDGAPSDMSIGSPSLNALTLFTNFYSQFTLAVWAVVDIIEREVIEFWLYMCKWKTCNA